mmetsp:Transcript_76027/g.203977  ORF Transcript_76027/g.203977 Transcript_76027/m.203977 type:complete len:304 (-) Transcript_76027:324-1235(-)
MSEPLSRPSPLSPRDDRCRRPPLPRRGVGRGCWRSDMSSMYLVPPPEKQELVSLNCTLFSSCDSRDSRLVRTGSRPAPSRGSWSTTSPAPSKAAGVAAASKTGGPLPVSLRPTGAGAASWAERCGGPPLRMVRSRLPGTLGPSCGALPASGAGALPDRLPSPEELAGPMGPRVSSPASSSSSSFASRGGPLPVALRPMGGGVTDRPGRPLGIFVNCGARWTGPTSSCSASLLVALRPMGVGVMERALSILRICPPATLGPSNCALLSSCDRALLQCSLSPERGVLSRQALGGMDLAARRSYLS